MMKRLLFYRTYHLLAITSLLLFAAGFFVGGKTVDIHVHDTYFIVGYNFLTIRFGFFLLLLWLLYLPLRKRLYRPLTFVHVALTIFCLITVAVHFSKNLPRTYYDLSAYRAANALLTVIILVFAIAQLLFLINLLAALFRRPRPDGHSSLRLNKK